jgi:hypothetical protein
MVARELEYWCASQDQNITAKLKLSLKIALSRNQRDLGLVTENFE